MSEKNNLFYTCVCAKILPETHINISPYVWKNISYLHQPPKKDIDASLLKKHTDKTQYGPPYGSVSEGKQQAYLNKKKEKKKEQPLVTKYNFILFMRKSFSSGKGPTFYQTTANTLPTTFIEICVQSGTADLDLPKELSTHGGTLCWSLSNMENTAAMIH